MAERKASEWEKHIRFDRYFDNAMKRKDHKKFCQVVTLIPKEKREFAPEIWELKKDIRKNARWDWIVQRRRYHKILRLVARIHYNDRQSFRDMYQRPYYWDENEYQRTLLTPLELVEINKIQQHPYQKGPRDMNYRVVYRPALGHCYC